MLKGILFDLDGTLLDIDIDQFLPRYFTALREFPLGPHVRGVDPDRVLIAIQAGARAMHDEHHGRTNLDVFSEVFAQTTGLTFESLWAVYERFYAEVFPTLKAGAGPAPGAHRAVEVAAALGMRIAVATNPIFPRVAVQHRLAWAGFDDAEFDVVTSYEDSTACKPRPAYFRETAGRLGLAPEDCMMVGDDVGLDLPAADVGMETFYVGQASATSARYSGSLDDLAELLPLLAPRS